MPNRARIAGLLLHGGLHVAGNVAPGPQRAAYPGQAGRSCSYPLLSIYGIVVIGSVTFVKSFCDIIATVTQEPHLRGSRHPYWHIKR